MKIKKAFGVSYYNIKKNKDRVNIKKFIGTKACNEAFYAHKQQTYEKTLHLEKILMEGSVQPETITEEVANKYIFRIRQTLVAFVIS